MRFTRQHCCSVGPLLLVLAGLSPAKSGAQELKRTELALAPSLVFYDLTRSKSQTPKTALGLSVLLGKPLGLHLKVRAVVGVWASLPGGDPVSICSPIPGGCAPDPVVPDRLWMAEAQAVWKVFSLPVHLLGGTGVSIPEGGNGSLPGGRALLRVGIELGDDQRWRGLRVQLARVVFPTEIADLSSGQGVAILFRF